MSKTLSDFPHPSQLQVVVDADGFDWVHVLDLDGNLVDQGHSDHVYERLVETFFAIDYRSGIDKVSSVAAEAPVSPPEALPNLKRLGSTQRACWYALERHGRWHQGCGWTYESDKETERLLDTLVARNLATATLVELATASYTVYRVIPGALKR